MGSALRLTEAMAIGAAPTRTMASAATAATERRRYDNVTRSHHPPEVAAPRAPSVAPSIAEPGPVSGAPPHRCGGFFGRLLPDGQRNREADHGQVADDQHQRHGNHRIGVGAHAAEEAKVLHEDPVS